MCAPARSTVLRWPASAREDRYSSPRSAAALRRLPATEDERAPRRTLQVTASSTPCCPARPTRRRRGRRTLGRRCTARGGRKTHPRTSINTHRYGRPTHCSDLYVIRQLTSARLEKIQKGSKLEPSLPLLSGNITKQRGFKGKVT